MANLLQSSQTQATQAPDYYTNYLSNIASAGTSQAGINPTTGQFDPTLGAQYVGPTDLQNTAFANVGNVANAYQPTLNKAGDVLQSAYSATSPLSAANPYLSAAGANPAMEASQYMDPYTLSVANQMSNIGQRNIQQNLQPQATSAGVGTGQYGSQRGAQVLGQVTANAENDLNSQIGQMLDKAYQTNLNAAVQTNQLQGQLGSTAANAASAGQQNLTNLGNTAANLATTNQTLGLADINALSTLGGQQQTIKQNQQLFPLTNLSTLSGLLRGYNVPTTTKTTAEGSPLSAAASLASLYQTPAASDIASKLKSVFSGLTSATPPNSSFVGTNSAGTNLYWDSSANGGVGGYVDNTGKAVAMDNTDADTGITPKLGVDE
jgi:hypothetical protein